MRNDSGVPTQSGRNDSGVPTQSGRNDSGVPTQSGRNDSGVPTQSGRKILISLGLVLTLFTTYFLLSTFLWAGSGATTETTFTSGTFSNTITTTGAADVKLKINFDAGNGADGAITISSANKNINTDIIAGGRSAPDGVNWQINNGVASGQQTISSAVARPAGFAIGDEIIIINLRGATTDYANAGLYEFKRITALPTGSSITVDSTIANAYDGTTQKIMVQRVPNYTNVTLDSGLLLYPMTWNGTIGGVIAFRATGTVTINGTLANNGMTYCGGFAGGAGGFYSGSIWGGYGGDSFIGDTGGNGGTGYGAPGTAGTTRSGGGGGGGCQTSTTGGAGGAGSIGLGGGGGGTGYGSTKEGDGGGGGGGGHGTEGSGGLAYPASTATAGLSGSTTTGGLGGNGAGASSTSGPFGGGGGGGGGMDGRADSTGLNTRAYLGAGGAGGGSGGSLTAIGGGKGGRGGGLIFVAAGTLTNTGLITAAGGPGDPGGNGNSGGGGGGSGGSVILIAQQINNGGSGINASGGAAGAGLGHGGAGGAGGAGRIYYRGSYSGSGSVNPAASTGSLPYVSSGSYLSDGIAPPGVSNWGVLNYTISSPTNTTLTIDVLKSDNTPLVNNVPNGTNLGTTYPAIFAGVTGIKLKANFTGNGTLTPTLSDWTINYTTGRIVNTAKWTSIVKNDRPVMMGHEVPCISWTAKADAGVAHWKSFRIRESGQQPVRVLDVAVYEESGNNGYWDKSDKLIAKGKFNENREVVLNMRQWPITTVEKTYYITEKVSMEGAGGSRIGLFLDNDSWLEFGDATCTGIPP